MPDDVEIIVFNIVGEPSITPNPSTIRRIRAYVRWAVEYGLSEEEITTDVTQRWPSSRCCVEIGKLPGGTVRVIFAPRFQAQGRHR